MKTKRPQRRYKSREEIVSLIDDAKFTIKAEGHEIDRRADVAERCKIWLGKNPQENIKGEHGRKQWHEQRNAMVSAQARIEELTTHRHTLEAKLRMLKEKLAAFDTETMAFLDDRSVV